MRQGLQLVMPMGGRGSRFSEQCYNLPKPLILLHEKPFFYWAVQSVKKFVKLDRLRFVVLDEHIQGFKIDQIILKYFPEAEVNTIPEVLPGPVCTCLSGLDGLDADIPVLFNDCDHLFCSKAMNDALNRNWDGDAGVVSFFADTPQFSYLRFDNGGRVVGAIEKSVVSNRAICGAYLFRNVEMFQAAAKTLLKLNQGTELYMSELLNILCRQNRRVSEFPSEYHVPFGTPSEYVEAQNSTYFKDLD